MQDHRPYRVWQLGCQKPQIPGAGSSPWRQPPVSEGYLTSVPACPWPTFPGSCTDACLLLHGRSQFYPCMRPLATCWLPVAGVPGRFLLVVGVRPGVAWQSCASWGLSMGALLPPVPYFSP